MKKQWPITVALREGRFFVSEVWEGYSGNIQTGNEIIRINGSHVREIYSDPVLLIKIFALRKILLELQDQDANTWQAEIVKVKR